MGEIGATMSRLALLMLLGSCALHAEGRRGVTDSSAGDYTWSVGETSNRAGNDEEATLDALDLGELGAESGHHSLDEQDEARIVQVLSRLSQKDRQEILTKAEIKSHEADDELGSAEHAESSDEDEDEPAPAPAPDECPARCHVWAQAAAGQTKKDKEKKEKFAKVHLDCCECEKKKDHWFAKIANAENAISNLETKCISETNFDRRKATTLATHINEHWNRTKGLDGCKHLLNDTVRLGIKNMTMVRQYEVERPLLFKVYTHATKEDVAAAGVQVGDHSLLLDYGYVINHRSGIHAIASSITSTNGGTEIGLLCSSWTSVCNHQPPFLRQQCATARLAVGCGSTRGRVSGQFQPCDLAIMNTISSIPNFA